jgi:hypothetical protein
LGQGSFQGLGLVLWQMKKVAISHVSNDSFFPQNLGIPSQLRQRDCHGLANWARGMKAKCRS